VTRYHLEAGLAAAHALAPSHGETNWPHILELYDALLALDASPVVALNRAVALAKVRGPTAGLAALEKIPHRRALERYHLFHAVRGQLLHDTGCNSEAAAALTRALDLAPQAAERELLMRKLAAV
jgi:RNA polymerase sigma-70 factor (ECF subfamily)